jgi:Lon protease-like protein
MAEIKAWLRRNLPLVFDRDAALKTLEIPIFPLNTVLFPGGLLPLRVFEQRYMDMTKECLREDKPFGVCLIKEGKEVGGANVIEEVGCLARITNWDMPQLGILNLETVGMQRFVIEEKRVEDNGLVVAAVATVSVEPPQPVPESLQSCVKVLQQIVQHVGPEKFSAPPHYDDASWVGYRLAEVLPLKLSARQNKLEMNDSIMRLQILRKFLIQQGLVEN